MDTQKKGLAAALSSNILFGVLYLYSTWMVPMSGTHVFAWRMVGMWFALLCIFLCSHGARTFAAFARRLGRDKRKWALVFLPTPILASQLWLFMWAPVNQHGIDITIGYFLFPLVMVVCGRIFLNERLSTWQWIAVAFAAAGVAHELWLHRTFSWVTLWACGTYPVYYILRRYLGVPALIGLLLDTTAILPVVIVYLALQPESAALWQSFNRYWLMIPLLGLISAAAMQLNLYASRSISVGLFGMLSYLEPVLMFVLAITVLDAPLNPSSLATYSLIWIGLCFSLYDSYLKTRQATRTGSLQTA